MYFLFLIASAGKMSKIVVSLIPTIWLLNVWVITPIDSSYNVTIKFIIEANLFPMVFDYFGNITNLMIVSVIPKLCYSYVEFIGTAFVVANFSQLLDLMLISIVFFLY